MYKVRGINNKQKASLLVAGKPNPQSISLLSIWIVTSHQCLDRIVINSISVAVVFLFLFGFHFTERPMNC